MTKKRTPPVKVGRFYVTSHAQNRMVKRDITADSVITNLCRKPAAVSPVKVDKKGPSYLRMNKDLTTVIDPKNKNVSTMYRTNVKDAKKYGFERSIHMERESERVARLKKESASKKCRAKKSSVAKKTARVKSTGKKSAVVRRKS